MVLALLVASLATASSAAFTQSTAEGSDGYESEPPPELSLGGPNRVKPKTMATFEASGFPSSTELGLILRTPLGGRCLNLKKRLKADARGGAIIKFRFPGYCGALNPRTGRTDREVLRSGQQVEVRVFSREDRVRAEHGWQDSLSWEGAWEGGRWDDAWREGLTYAIKAVRVLKSSRRHIVIPTTANKAILRVVCPADERCAARVTVKTGKGTVARGDYSVSAGRARKVRLLLTRIGRQKLSRAKHVRAKATITDSRTGKAKSFPVTLKAMGG